MFNLQTLSMQASRDCVQKTLKRLEDKITGKVLAQIMYAMYSSEKAVGQRCACALAHLAAISDLPAAFLERKGLDIIIAMLTDTGKGDKHAKMHREAACASLDSWAQVLMYDPRNERE